MKKHRFVAFLLAAVMLACVLPFGAYAESPALAGKNIIAFGDSLTALGSPSYVKYLSDELGVSVVNAGVGGNMTVHARARFESDVLSKNPDIVLMCFGMNDQACSLPSGQSWTSHDTFIEDMSFFIEQLQSKGCEVILITPHPVYEASGYYQSPSDHTYNYPGSLDAFCKMIRELAVEYGCGLVDMNYEFNLLKANDLSTFISYYAQGDGIHQSQAGRQFWAKIISDYLYAAYDGASKAEMTVNCVDADGRIIKTVKHVGASGANITLVPPAIPSYTTSDAEVKTSFVQGKTVTFTYTSDLLSALEKAENADYSQYGNLVLADLRSEYVLGKKLLADEGASFDAMQKCTDRIEELLGITGNKLLVISNGKSYTRPEPNYYKWDSSTQSNSDELNETYSDDYIRLTDGKKAHVPGNSSSYSAWTSDVEIIIDLGSVMKTSSYAAYFAYGPWGISLPAALKISCSEDGNSWSSVIAAAQKTTLAEGNSTDWGAVEYRVNSKEIVNARYVKFNITKSGGFVWMDEAEVSVASPAVGANAVISGVNGNISNGTQLITENGKDISGTDNIVAEFYKNGNIYKIKEVNAETASLSAGDIIIASAGNTVLANAKAGQFVQLYGVDEKIALCFAIAESAEEFGVPDHVHEFSEDWEMDETGHWHECACGEICDFAEHTPGPWVPYYDPNYETRSCSVCGFALDTRPVEKNPTDPTEPTDPTDPTPEYGIGDVNKNGEIDSTDYALVKRAYFGTYKLDESEFALADVNGNNEIDSNDYTLVKRVYFGTYKFD